MSDESAGILFIPSSLGGGGMEESFRKALEDKGAVVPMIVKRPADELDQIKHVTYAAEDASVTEQLMKAMMGPISERSKACPYGPLGGLHSPTCFCTLSPSAQETVLWNEFSERF